jgi:hypothetical protein
MQIGLAVLGSVVLGPLVSWAQTEVPLRDQLRSKLRARRDTEFEFIDRVAILVLENKLPKDLVLALMDYAVRKNAHIPYPWFEQAVRIKANELGVEI